jgi:TetR/AcrR family transcriptional regulator, transcriptional repressor for nem operon
VVEAIAQGLKGEVATRDARAWALLSLLTGAVTIARAVEDEAVGARIAEGARVAAIVIVAG